MPRIWFDLVEVKDATFTVETNYVSVVMSPKMNFTPTLIESVY